MMSLKLPTRNKILLIILSCIFTQIHSKSLSPYIGIHGGINFSQAISIGDNQQIVTLLNGEEIEEKTYTSFFKNFGHQIGFSLYLNINNNLSIGFLPEIAKYSYGYSSSMTFYNALGDSALIINNTSKVKLNYFNLPLIIQYQYEFNEFSPYIFMGASYGLMRNVQHSAEVHSQLQEDNNLIEFSETSTDNYSSEYISSKINLLGGIGIKKDFNLFYLTLDISYWLGLHNLINESGRYSTQTISGTTYDIPNDLKLNHLGYKSFNYFPY
jgi:hypothetical protein